MKPFVIYVEPNRNGKIVLTKEEFELYIQDAYERGYTDGKRAIIVPPTSTPPCTSEYVTLPYITCTSTSSKIDSSSINNCYEVELRNTENKRSITLHS